MIQITEQGSILDKISVHAELHDSNRYFIVELNTNRNCDIERVIGLARPVDINLRSAWFSGGHATLTSHDISHFRQFANKLLDVGLISPNDRLNLQEQIKKIDDIFQYSKSIVDSKTIAQKEILELIASPYVEALIEDTHDFKDIVPLLSFALSRFVPAEHLWKSKIKDSEKSDQEIDESEECMKHLSLLIKGKADLSSTFMRSGNGIPSIEQQRHIIIEFIRKSFEEKYGKQRADIFDEFYLELALLKLQNGSRLRKNISYGYIISWDSGFPVADTKKRVEINDTGISLRQICKKDFLPTEEEKMMLKKYGLKRFPISVDDMVHAKADHPDEMIENPRDLRLSIDKELYPNMSPLEKLYLAIDEDEADEIGEILSDGSIDINEPLFVGDTALTVASSKGSQKALVKLIENGADVNVSRNYGMTPLHLAALNQNTEIIEILLDRGAHFIADDKGDTALHLFFCRESKLAVSKIVEIAQLLMEKGSVLDLNDLLNTDGNNCFHRAAMNGNRNGILALVDLGVDVHKKNQEGYTEFDLIFDPIMNNPLANDEEIQSIFQ